MSKQNTRRAVGLKYNEGKAPEVVAKGQGDIADEIIALANQHGILIHEDEQLCQWLAALDLGQAIPPELYHIIAELIAFSFVLQGRTPEHWNNVHNKIDNHV